jgi:penicillin-binding protein 1B
MPVKVKIDQPQKHSIWWTVLRVALIAVVVVILAGAGIFLYFYHHYEGLVSERLKQGPLFASVAQIYAAPQEVRPGQQRTADEIAGALRRASYNTNPEMGTYRLQGDTIQVKPGPESYLAADGATIVTSDGQVKTITAEDGAPLAGYKLEPQLITALSEGDSRTKRRMVTYSQIPPRMVQAILAIEDRRFFEHGGINYGRTMECVVQDLIARKRECGGSTLTQQLARGFFLTPQKTLSRKIAEAMIALQLESRFNKQQIFEMYANEVNIGQRGSFAIQGIGEAAQAYFGKDLRQLDLAEMATIAGIINSPNWLNPYRHPTRAMTRRNLVLDSMVETGAIKSEEAELAKAEPLKLAAPNVDGSEAPYFVDLVHDQITQRLGDTDLARSSSLRIYTSLDPQLQAAATDAVEEGMKHVDELIRKYHRKGDENITYPQVALVALDPHTGQVLALVGGRNYGVSQLDHAISERPTGSTFKPFVYASAFNTSLNGTNLDGNGVFTSLTSLNDDPTTFTFDGKTYTPGNFVRGEWPGMVTAIQALAHSLNIATINLAQMVGFDNVAALARQAGLVNARGTPSVAIGTYSATPLDMAGAYTVFANNGVHLKPWLLSSVRNPNGDVIADYAPEAKQVLDPRVAYLTQSLLEDVMTFGTGISARADGFTAPAAGKTGTEHDVWFVGYSSNLLCVVWVGNDDYTDLSHGLTHRLQGADAAVPIWAEFMNRAIKLPQYSDMKPFTAPDGVEVLRIDRATDLPADATCPSDGFTAAFLVGTAPQGTCSRMGEDSQSLLDKLFHPQPVPNLASPGNPNNPANPNNPQDDGTKHRNFFQKMFGIGKDKQQQQQQPEQPNSPQD